MFIFHSLTSAGPRTTAENLLHDLSIWSPYIDFQIYPVVDVMEASAMQQKAIEFRKSVD